MGFQSVDELNTFSFEDCQITGVKLTSEGINLEVEALIVRPENSQNTNFTTSYAGTTQIRLQGGKIVAGCKEGYKYYNANEELISEKPDEAMDVDTLTEILKKADGAYLFSIMENKSPVVGQYRMGLEFVDESEYGGMSDSFWLDFDCDKIIFNWERYMNRVQM